MDDKDLLCADSARQIFPDELHVFNMNYVFT